MMHDMNNINIDPVVKILGNENENENKSISCSNFFNSIFLSANFIIISVSPLNASIFDLELITLVSKIVSLNGPSRVTLINALFENEPPYKNGSMLVVKFTILLSCLFIK